MKMFSRLAIGGAGRLFLLGLPVLAPVAVMFLAPSAVVAQIATGSLAGTVSDASGGVISGAQVVAKDQASGTVYQTTTSSSGSYVFPSMRAGTYDLAITSSSFATAKVSGLPIDIGTRASKDVTLSAGGTAETVTVLADSPSLETETSDVGTVLTSQQVEDLPIAVGGAFRSVSSLSFLAPGAVGPGTNGGTFQAKIAGGQTLGSEYLVDGISTYRSENGTGDFDSTTPSVDAIEEFRVETSSLPADYGRTTGGIANFKTRSGTNSYHGHVYDFFKNNGLDANNWFNNGRIAQAGNTPAAQRQFKRAPDTKNDYGVTLGGPVTIPFLYHGKDRTFFFFNFEQLKYHTGGTDVTTVPTVAQRAGDFSAFLGPQTTANNVCTGKPLQMGQLFDPGTPATNINGVLCRSTPFANNQIPMSRFSPLALKVLALIPLPTPGFQGTGTQNYTQTYVATTTNTDFSGRLDQNFGAKHHVFVFGSARENSNPGNKNLPGPISGDTVTDQFYKYGRAGWDFTITPHLVNQLTIGGNRVNSFNASGASFGGTNYVQQLGIPNVTGSVSTTFPTFNIGEGLPGLGNSNLDDNVDNGLIANESVNISLGKHSVRIGGTYRWQQFSYSNNGTSSGTFNFGRAQTAGTSDSGAITGNGIASFLLGAPGDISRTVQTHAPRWMQHYYDAFIQDDYKVLPNLTLNLGIRYSIDTPRYEATGASSNFDPTLVNTQAGGLKGALAFSGNGPGRNGNTHETWANTYYKNFEPRVGFSYSPAWLHRAAVLRGAYTIISGPLEYADYGQGTSAGFTQGHDFNSFSINPVRSLDSGFPTGDTYTVNTDSTQRNGNQIDYIEKQDGRPSTIQNWSLETQTQLAPDLIFTLGYVGQHSVRLRGYLNEPNDIAEGYLGLGDTLGAPITSSQAAAAGVTSPFPNFINYYGGPQNGANVGQALRPFPQFGFMSNDNYLQNRGQATYHAMEAKLERRFHSGLNVLASYTWSKTMTDADSIQPFFATLLGQGGTQNPYNLKSEKAVSNQDVPNNFVVSYLYELPVGHGKKFLGKAPKAVDLVVGGWRIGGIQRYLSGQPVSFYGRATGPPSGFSFGTRPNRVQGVSLLTQLGKSGGYNPFDNTQRIFNQAAFSDPNAQSIRHGGPFHFGNLSRNVTEYRTPVSLNEDLSLNKSFTIHEGIKVDFRGEMFNAFNRHIFNKPDTGIDDPNFGQIGSTLNGPRTAQLVLKIQY